MTLGAHGSTYGGNPLATAIGNAVLDVVLEPGFLERVARLGGLFRQKLAALEDRYPHVIESVRGEGLMSGVKTRVPNMAFAAAARDAKLLTIPASDNVVRLLPPLIVSENEIAEAARRLETACASFAREPARAGAVG